MNLTENELKVLSCFFYDEVDAMGRKSIHGNGSNHYYPTFLKGMMEITKLPENNIYEAVKGLYQKRLIDLTWDKDLNIESVHLNENGARIYGDYRVEMMEDNDK